MANNIDFEGTDAAASAVTYQAAQIPVLKGQENWQEWDVKLRMNLQYFGLQDFIDGTVTVSEDATTATKTKYRQARAQCLLTLVNSLHENTLEKLQDAGWDNKTAEPYGTYTKLKEVILKVTGDTISDIITAFVKVDLKDFNGNVEK